MPAAGAGDAGALSAQRGAAARGEGGGRYRCGVILSERDVLLARRCIFVMLSIARVNRTTSVAASIRAPQCARSEARSRRASRSSDAGFQGDMDAVARVLDAGPHVFNHNMETVPRLYRRVRPQADYRQSLEVLRFARRHRPEVMTKSGFMAGLGETAAEVEQLLGDLRAQDVDVATIGQYLQPTRRNLQVAEYVTPEQFDRYRDLRPFARLQNGVQRTAGAQFLHGRSRE